MEDEGRLNVSSDFGNLLRRLRLTAGLSQEALAERARMSVNGIGALERGYRRTPQRETVALLAQALTLSDEQRREFEAAARSGAPRRVARSSSISSPWQDSTKSNLPWFLTSFVGRERDVAEVKELLVRHRLLTLTGSGGVGKTRLAIQVGTELLDRYPDGVWFVDLAPITDPELVSSVVAKALGITQRQEHRLEDVIAQWLKHKRLLLIVDNCEHVLERISELATAILATAQDVHIMTTSRQWLNINGEAVHRLPSLAVPDEPALMKTDEVQRYGAAALFVDRAAAADTRFILTDDTAPIIAEICRRLDGIPLAIELAAACVTVLSISNLAQRLNERFQILTGGSRTALPRQQTLTALIDWSYDLLTPPEQLLFVRLGIFAGGFGLDAVTAVCGNEGLEEFDLLDLLASLIDKSLVIADTSGEQERFRLLESTTAYALEKLDASGERDRFARRHAEYFRDQAEAARERYGAGSTIAWLARAELELDNYRTALEWALTRGNDAVVGGAIAGALARLWWAAGLAVEGRYWIELALARVVEAEDPAGAALLQLALSLLSNGKSKHDAAERAMQLYESVSDPHGAALARRSLGFALHQMQRLDEASEAIVQALADSRARGDAWHVADGLNMQGIIEWSRGNLGEARELYGQALGGMRAVGDELGTALVLGCLAELEFAEGHPDQALHLVNEAIELGSLNKNLAPLVILYSNTAAYRIEVGDLAGAGKSAREAVRLGRHAQAGPYLICALQHLALLAVLGGDTRCAAHLLGYVDAQYDRVGMKLDATERWGHDKLVAKLRETLSEREIKNLTSDGAVWSEDQAVAEALKI